MTAKLIIAILLAASSVAASGQLASGRASAAVWPHIHQFTINPSMAEVCSIELHLVGSPGESGGPTITAHAINTKGTGCTAGRAGRAIVVSPQGEDRAGRAIVVRPKGGDRRETHAGDGIKIEIGAAGQKSGEVSNQSPIAVDRVVTVVTGDEAAQKAAAAPFAFMQADGQGLGWSCSVSGSEHRPTFRVSMFVPAALAQTGASRAGWSGGAGNSHGRVAIVPRSAGNNDSWHVACVSKEPRPTNYDLVMNKKP